MRYQIWNQNWNQNWGYGSRGSAEIRIFNFVLLPMPGEFFHPPHPHSQAHHPIDFINPACQLFGEKKFKEEKKPLRGSPLARKQRWLRKRRAKAADACAQGPCPQPAVAPHTSSSTQSPILSRAAKTAFPNMNTLVLS